MNETFPMPFGECDVCGKPLEYERNPNWESIKHLFRLEPSRGFWLAKDHPYCLERLKQNQLKEKDKKNRDEKAIQINRAMSDLGFPKILMDKPFAAFHVEAGNQRAKHAIENWTYTATGILLTGPPGRGKSHLMAGFAKKWLEMGMNVVFQNMSLLLALLRRGYEDDLFDDRLRFISSQAQILILDDLGAEKPTAWGEEKLYMIIDTRLCAKLPLFVTTNCTQAELEEKFHPRILSRLKEMCTWIEVGGQDWRQAIHKSREQPAPSRTQTVQRPPIHPPK